MSQPLRKPLGVEAPAPTAISTATFVRNPRRGNVQAKERPLGRVPRVARLLALAHRIDGMIRAGELKDWAEAARLVRVTRARMTQIANLILLAPEIQEAVLRLRSALNNCAPVTEHALRVIVTEANWMEHYRAWLAKTRSLRADLPLMRPPTHPSPTTHESALAAMSPSIPKKHPE